VNATTHRLVVLQKRKLIWYSQGKRAKETRYGRAESV
jgi:hypothetical protein